MCLVGNSEELARKKAYLAPLVERLGNVPGALSTMNNRDEDALYLAAMNCPEMPYVTGYLAAAMLQKRIDIGQILYHMRVSFLGNVRPRESRRVRRSSKFRSLNAYAFALRSDAREMFRVNRFRFTRKRTLLVGESRIIIISARARTIRFRSTVTSLPRRFQGDTLIHSIAARGDSHGEVLAELLALRTQQGNPVFDLSKCNYDGQLKAGEAGEAKLFPIGRKSSRG